MSFWLQSLRLLWNCCHQTFFIFISLNTVCILHLNCIFSMTLYSCILDYLALTWLWRVKQDEFLFLKTKITLPRACGFCANVAMLIWGFFLPNKDDIVETWILHTNSRKTMLVNICIDFVEVLDTFWIWDYSHLKVL